MSVYVKLIASTPDADKVVAAAAKICYSPSGAAEILDGLDEGKTASFLTMLRKAGHFSPFEHASFTFAIEGLSRVATHQLVRHRVASYSQQSQRYVEMKGNCCIVPPSVAENAEAKAVFEKQAEAAFETYRKLVDLGVPREDARFILPHERARAAPLLRSEALPQGAVGDTRDSARNAARGEGRRAAAFRHSRAVMRDGGKMRGSAPLRKSL